MRNVSKAISEDGCSDVGLTQYRTFAAVFAVDWRVSVCVCVCVRACACVFVCVCVCTFLGHEIRGSQPLYCAQFNLHNIHQFDRFGTKSISRKFRTAGASGPSYLPDATKLWYDGGSRSWPLRCTCERLF